MNALLGEQQEKNRTIYCPSNFLMENENKMKRMKI